MQELQFMLPPLGAGCKSELISIFIAQMSMFTAWQKIRSLPPLSYTQVPPLCLYWQFRLTVTLTTWQPLTGAQKTLQTNIIAKVRTNHTTQ